MLRDVLIYFVSTLTNNSLIMWWEASVYV